MRESELLVEAKQFATDGLYQDAEHLLEAGRLAYPKSAPIRRDLALLHQKRGSVRRARTVLGEAMQLSPASIALKLLDIELSRQAGALEHAVATADRLLETSGLDPASLCVLIEVYATAGHHEQVIRCLVQLSPEAQTALDVGAKLRGARACFNTGDPEEARYWLLQSLSQPLAGLEQLREFCLLACELGLAAAAMPAMMEFIARDPLHATTVAARFAGAGHVDIAVRILEALANRQILSPEMQDAPLAAWRDVAERAEAAGDAQGAADAWSVCVVLGDREHAASEFRRLAGQAMSASAGLTRIARLRRFSGDFEQVGTRLADIVEEAVREQTRHADTTAPADAIALAQWFSQTTSMPAALQTYGQMLRDGIDAATGDARYDEAARLAQALSAVAPGDALAAAILGGTFVRREHGEAAIPHLRILAFREPDDEHQVESYLSNLLEPGHREIGLRDARLILRRNPASQAARKFLTGWMNDCLVQGA